MSMSHSGWNTPLGGEVCMKRETSAPGSGFLFRLQAAAIVDLTLNWKLIPKHVSTHLHVSAFCLFAFALPPIRNIGIYVFLEAWTLFTITTITQLICLASSDLPLTSTYSKTSKSNVNGVKKLFFSSFTLKRVNEKRIRYCLCFIWQVIFLIGPVTGKFIMGIWSVVKTSSFRERKYLVHS